MGSCPSCDSPMHVRRLECPSCGVGVDGRFDIGLLARLSGEQLAFVETFLRARGKIKDVEEDLSISYPTVVARLNDVLVSLGFEAGDDAREGERRQRVLDDLAAGRITAAQAAEELRSEGARSG
ncbi:MAG: DUF2089 domain-containing protein [Tepidiformaceae bacterium]